MECLLTVTSKMPGPGFALPPGHPRDGGSCPGCENNDGKLYPICNDCYGKRGRFRFDSSKIAMARRLEQIYNDPLWVDSMIVDIHRSNRIYFRGNVNGDFPTEKNVDQWITICSKLPNKRFHFPTKCVGVSGEFNQALSELNSLPNVVVRPSSGYYDTVINTNVSSNLAMVVTTLEVADHFGAWYCPAVAVGNCRHCRSCWSKNCRLIAYQRHVTR